MGRHRMAAFVIGEATKKNEPSICDRFGISDNGRERLVFTFVDDCKGHLCRVPSYVEFLAPEVRLVRQRWRPDVCRFCELDIISLAI